MVAGRIGYRGACVLTGACLAAALGSWPASASPGTAAAPALSARWHIAKTIKQTSLQLWDVVAVPGGRAWVTGSHGTLITSPLFYHWTGARWVKIPRPGVNANNVFAASVSATSDTNVWGALSNGGGVDHWNGHIWERFFFGTPQTAAIGGVAAVGRHLGWAFTHDFNANTNTARLFNGSTFGSQPLPALVDGDGQVNQVSAASRSDIWAWAITSSAVWEAMHFNGTTWLEVSFPSALIPHNGGPSQILAESPTNVWGTVNEATTAKRIELVHWNGTKWQEVLGKGRPVGNLTGPIAPDGHGGLWVYAVRHKNTFPFLTPFFVHYRGGAFTTQAAPASPLGTLSIDAIALIPGTRSLWGVGWIEGKSGSAGGVIVKFGR